MVTEYYALDYCSDGGYEASVSERLDPAFEAERLDETAGFLGMGRSLSFPFPQWRARDEYRTVFFDEGYGHPLVFVHGLGGNATHWEFVASQLVSRYRVVGLDLVGFGWTRKPHRPYDVELLRNHLLDFIDRRGIGRATLVGHSLGGAVCLSAALHRPGQFDSLALLCAAGVAPLPRWMRMAAPVFLHRKLLSTVLAYGANFIVDNVFCEGDEENAGVRWFRDSALRDEPGHSNLRDFARVCESLGRELVAGDYSHRLASLHLPVLALWGNADKLTHLGSTLKQLDKIQRVRTVVLERCGHLPMIERPADTLFHLERLLDNPP